MVETAFTAVEIIEAGNLDEVSEAIASRRGDIDLVLFDLNMPGVRGFSGLIYIRAQYPDVPVCVISAAEEPATMRNAMALGASGFVPKSGSTDRSRRQSRRSLTVTRGCRTDSMRARRTMRICS